MFEVTFWLMTLAYTIELLAFIGLASIFGIAIWQNHLKKSYRPLVVALNIYFASFVIIKVSRLYPRIEHILLGDPWKMNDRLWLVGAELIGAFACVFMLYWFTKYYTPLRKPAIRDNGED